MSAIRLKLESAFLRCRFPKKKDGEWGTTAMRTEHILMRLEEYHGRIAMILKRAAGLFVALSPDAADLAHVRWELTRALREFQLFKHMEMFDPLLTSSVVSRRMEAAALKARCLAMADTFNQRAARWTLADVSSARIDCLADVRDMVRQLSAFLAEERLNIRKLLDGVERMRAA